MIRNWILITIEVITVTMIEEIILVDSNDSKVRSRQIT